MVRLANSVVPAIASGELQPLSTPLSAANQSLTLTLTLKRSDQSGFDTSCRRAEPRITRLSAFYDTAAAFGSFWAKSGRVRQVLDWLQAQGLRLVQGSANRLTISVRGTRQQAEAAFGSPSTTTP